MNAAAKRKELADRVVSCIETAYIASSEREESKFVSEVYSIPVNIRSVRILVKRMIAEKW